MPQRAAVYARISSDRAGEGLGVERQESLCRDLADRKGWPVVETFADNDISAYAGAPRPQYRAMLEAIRAGDVDAVLCVDLDRLTRQPAELETFIALADEFGVALANVSGDVDLSTSDGRFRARIMGAVARQESEKKSERLRRQRDQRAKAGKPHPAPRRFGWNEDMTELDTTEAALIRSAVRDLMAGASYRGVAREWNAKGVTTVPGNEWTTSAVRDLMRNPRLCGLRVHRGEIVGEGTWPPIIDRDTFERLQAVRRANHTQVGRPPARLLTGLLVCAKCEHTLSAAGSMKTASRAYACRKQPGRGHAGACGSLQIAGPPAEDWIRDAVLHRLSSPAFVEAVAQVGDTAGHAAAVEDLQAAEDRLAEIADMFGAGELDRAAYLRARDLAEERQTKARAAVDAHTTTTALEGMPRSGDLRDWWETLTMDRQRAVLQTVLSKVTVEPFDPKGPRRFQPERLDPDWRA